MILDPNNGGVKAKVLDGSPEVALLADASHICSVRKEAGVGVGVAVVVVAGGNCFL